jgi:hypothetical protein
MTTLEKIILIIKSNLRTVLVNAGWTPKPLTVRSANDDEDSGRTIVNFNACNQYQSQLIQDAVIEAGGTDNLTEEQANELANHHLTYSFPTSWIENGSMERPQKGDPFYALMITKRNKDNTADILVVDRIKPVAKATVVSVDLDNLGDAPESVSETESDDIKEAVK